MRGGKCRRLYKIICTILRDDVPIIMETKIFIKGFLQWIITE